MASSALLAALLVCVALAGLMLVLALRARGRHEGQAASHEAGGKRLHALGALLRPEEGKGLDELKSRVTRAGLYSQDQLDLFLTVRLISAVLGVGSIVLVISTSDDMLSAVASMMVLGLVSVVGPGWWLDRRAAERQAAIARALPATLDLLVVCLGAGMGLIPALERVASAGREGEILSEELTIVAEELQMGVALEQAFRRFATRIGSDDVSSFAGVIIKASAMGAQVGELLAAHAERMRETHLMELEEKAGKANAKLSLPLTTCLLPSGMLILLAPPFITLFRVL